jgi:hypothetical protein
VSECEIPGTRASGSAEREGGAHPSSNGAASRAGHAELASGGPDSALMLKRAAGPWLAHVESALDYLGDFLNPILVKEARQAMKSRQFSVTFALLLILGWIWTVGFIAYWNVSLYYQSYGMSALTAYFLVLTVPMLVVIPFATFRSLAAETEDGTFELMSITTLSARQIAIGKLASAVLQMLVYYSALAPCIAFTYLLRGIDIVTIGLLLVHTFLASVLLSLIGLVAATLSRARMWQVLSSVLLIMGLLVFTLIWDYLAMAAVYFWNGTLPYDQWWFWVVNAAAVSFAVAFCVLFLFVAAAQITFASENRSTPIRWVLVVIHLMLVGWMVYMWRIFPYGRSDLMLVTMEILAAIYWMFTGAILTGETAELSPRAKRNLPQSLLGRSLLTWFNPGSGSGYTFTVLNLAGVLLTHGMVVWIATEFADDRVPPDSNWFYAGICLLGYVAGYLGIVRLSVTAIRRQIPVTMLTVFLLHVVVVLAGVFVPLAILSMQYGISGYDFEYTPLQLTNWVWTLAEILDRGTAGAVGEYLPFVILAVGGTIFLINLIDTSSEVEKVRTIAPQRVLEDDAAKRPVIRLPKNPWDDGKVGGEKVQVSGFEERAQGSEFKVQEGEGSGANGDGDSK